MFRVLLVLAAGLVFLSNLLGLAAMAFATTSYLSVSLSLSLVAFISFNLAGLIFFSTHWVRVIMPYEVPLLATFPVLALEKVSYSLRVVSLSVRLFANVTSGHLLLHVLAGIL